ncbi:unnamed protein product [Linum tenue]|uniref:Uncharacterized protein n=1 Tax=Linum tenue TaxID=586396 RepID=A0AAV0KQH0_9ROSI|nr:unnamed protein product [Linum tenue]
MAFGFYNISLHEDSIALATFKTVQRNVFIPTSAGIVGTLSRALHNGIPWVLTVVVDTIEHRLRERLKF